MRLIGWIIAVLVASHVAASAQDIAAGQALARKQCSGCHYAGKEAKPPFGFAPAFTKIARTKGMTETSIQVYLTTQHEVMPNYVLSPKEVRDVAAYIASLR